MLSLTELMEGSIRVCCRLLLLIVTDGSTSSGESLTSTSGLLYLQPSWVRVSWACAGTHWDQPTLQQGTPVNMLAGQIDQSQGRQQCLPDLVQVGILAERHRHSNDHLMNRLCT